MRGSIRLAAPSRCVPVNSDVIRHMQMTKVLKTLLLTSVVFAAGIKVGVHLGEREFVLRESPARATAIAAELRATRAAIGGGKFENLLLLKEYALDYEVTRAMDFRESGHPWIFWPYAPDYDNDRYLQHVAAYRAKHPSPLGDIAQVQGVAGQSIASQVKERTAELLRVYGK